MRNMDVLVLSGETGSGKSTQLAQFFVNEPWMAFDKPNGPAPCIVITQPRRIAAISLAKRVAKEMRVNLGDEVGYAVRFDNRSGPKTRIKFVTEGILLQEMLRDPDLKRYRMVILDEVHERTTGADLLLALIKAKVKSRAETAAQGKGHGLKMGVMSATIQVEPLVKYLDNAVPDGKQITFCYIEGRQHPVDTFYLAQPQKDYVEACLVQVMNLHYSEPMPGDILVFLPGQEDIESLGRLLQDLQPAIEAQSEVPHMWVLPLYGGLSKSAQEQVFEKNPLKTRKVILATNIAETSLTIPGVRLVVDTGLMKSKQFRPSLSLESLLVTPISRSSADQRKGRAGREGPGKCFRLYTKQTYESLPEFSVPEIKRVELSQTVLALAARGVTNFTDFDWIDRPSKDSLERAIFHLHCLGALAQGKITPLGKQMAGYPLEPTQARVLIEAFKPENADVKDDVIDILAAVSTENLLLNLPLSMSDEKREEVYEARKPFMRREGDHIFFLGLVRHYNSLSTRSERNEWAKKCYANTKSLNTVQEVQKQLHGLHPSAKRGSSPQDINTDRTIPPERAEKVLKVLLVGFFSNTALLAADGSYKTIMTSQRVKIHPSSCLSPSAYVSEHEDLRAQRRKPPAVMYNDYVFTTEPFARCVSGVSDAWIQAAMPGTLARNGGSS